jgi:hypothetical protein
VPHAFVLARIDTVEDNLAKDRSEMELAKLMKSITEQKDPSFVKLRIDNEDPRFANCITDRDSHEPSFISPMMDTAEERRA